MPRGEARLGPLAIEWDVPSALPDAAGGLEHLATGPGERACWSIREGAPPPAPTHVDAFYGRVLVDVSSEDGVIVWSPEARLVVARRSVEGVARGPSALPASIALHALAAYAGLTHLHAALVSSNGRNVLAPGGSGAGKTSFALAIAAHEGALHADDVVYVDSTLRGWPVRRPPHATQTTLLAHPELTVLGPVEDGVVSKVRVHAPGEPPREGLPIHAVLVPSLGAGPTRIEALDPAEAFAMLLGASALAVVDGSPGRNTMLDSLARLAELPVARLVAGADALTTPRVIAEELDRWLRTLVQPR